MIIAWVILLLVLATLSVITPRLYTVVIYLGVYSIVASFCFLLLAAPDVALAEAVVSTLSTILFLVALKKHDQLVAEGIYKMNLREQLLPFTFTTVLTLLFIRYIPSITTNPLLKDGYLAGFAQDVGGSNAVTAIYLGYRMYDTVFEALMLLVSIVAVTHLSWHGHEAAKGGEEADVPE